MQEAAVVERANPGATRFGMALRGGPGRPLIFVIIYIFWIIFGLLDGWMDCCCPASTHMHFPPESATKADRDPGIPPSGESAPRLRYSSDDPPNSI